MMDTSPTSALAESIRRIDDELDESIARRRELAAMLYRAGMTMRAVALRLGVSTETVYRDLMALDVPRRKQGDTGDDIRSVFVKDEAPPSPTPAAAVAVNCASDASRPQCCGRGMLPVGDPHLTHWHCLRCGENRRVR